MPFSPSRVEETSGSFRRNLSLSPRLPGAESSQNHLAPLSKQVQACNGVFSLSALWGLCLASGGLSWRDACVYRAGSDPACR